MTVTRESRRMSRVTPLPQIGVTFAVSHDYPSRPVPTRPICSHLAVGGGWTTQVQIVTAVGGLGFGATA